MALLDDLARTLGEGRVLGADAAPQAAHRDICRYDLGTPCGWVRPRSTSEVVTVVEAARTHGVALVPVGQRSAYWWPLQYDGALALDVSGLDAVGDIEAPHEPVWCGAGATVRAVDEAFRAHGQVLPCHPDAYGDTSVGAMVATGFTSGCGVGTAGLDGMVGGLKVVLGTGEVLATGTGNVVAGRPFVRGGLPDLTGVFFASDGALGVVTEVAVRPWPAAHLAQLHLHMEGSADRLLEVGCLAAGFRVPGVYETFRAVSVTEPHRDGPKGVDVDVLVRSPLGAAELDGRIATVQRAFLDACGQAPRVVAREEPGGTDRVPRWWGEPGGAWEMLGPHQFVGVDVNLPYDRLVVCMQAADAIAQQARALPYRSIRRALYAAPDHLNLGLHMVFEAPGGDALPEAHALVAHGTQRFAGLGVTPYRWGRVWGQAMASDLDPAYARCMQELKGLFDPDSILHPGASLWG